MRGNSNPRGRPIFGPIHLQSNPPENQENDHDAKDESQSSGWGITPVSTM
jgi:hypothetical protein